MTEQFVPPKPYSTAKRRILIIAMFIWAPFAVVIGDRWADTVTFRINNLASIPGAGTIQRDSEGVFHHVNEDGRSRAVFPELDPPLYAEECLDCRLVTGEQLSQTNEFCAVGVRTQLPVIDFQLPCRTWAVISDATKVMSFLVFILPFGALMLLRWLWRQAFRRDASET